MGAGLAITFIVVGVLLVVFSIVGLVIWYLCGRSKRAPGRVLDIDYQSFRGTTVITQQQPTMHVQQQHRILQPQPQVHATQWSSGYMQPQPSAPGMQPPNLVKF